MKVFIFLIYNKQQVTTSIRSRSLTHNIIIQSFIMLFTVTVVMISKLVWKVNEHGA
jgi:hypothetical protein